MFKQNELHGWNISIDIDNNIVCLHILLQMSNCLWLQIALLLQFINDVGFCSTISTPAISFGIFAVRNWQNISFSLYVLVCRVFDRYKKKTEKWIHNAMKFVQKWNTILI